jgi:hypothetical protein
MASRAIFLSLIDPSGDDVKVTKPETEPRIWQFRLGSFIFGLFYAEAGASEFAIIFSCTISPRICSGILFVAIARVIK